MPKHEGARHADPMQCLAEEFGLRGGRPDRAAGPLGIAVTWTVEGDDAVVFGCRLREAARHEVLEHAAVAVQEHQGGPLTDFSVVDLHAIDVDEAAGWRVVALGLPCPRANQDGRQAQGHGAQP